MSNSLCNKSQRLQYVDILKGISIICITLLHYESGVFPTWLNICIGMFMITAFYFVTGWIMGCLDKRLGIKELAKKRLRSLGVPYFWFTIAILIFDFCLICFGYYDWRNLQTHIFNALTFRGIGTLWFLPSLFVGELIFVYLRNKGNVLLILFAFISTVVYLHYYYMWQGEYRNLSDIYRIIDAPLHTLSRMLTAWPVIGVGYFISKNFRKQITILSPLKLTVAGLIISGLFFTNLIHEFIKFGDLGGIIYYSILPFGLLLLCMVLPSGHINSFFTFWGKNSLVLMVTHYSFLLEISIIINQSVFRQVEFSGIYTLYYFIITIIMEYPIVWFFNHKGRFMIGK